MLPNNQVTPTVSLAKPLFSYLQKQSENEKFMRSLEIAATFILISFFLVFAILPTASAISSLLGEIKSKELMTSKLRVKINDVIAAQDTFSRIQEKYFLVNSSLPDRPDFYGSANQLVATLSEVGASTTKLTFNLNDDKPVEGFPVNIKTYSLTTPIGTNFESSKTIISSLIQNRRVNSLPAFTFALGEEEDGAKLKLSLSTNYYYWSEKP